MKRSIKMTVLFVFFLFSVFGSTACRKDQGSSATADSSAPEWVTIDEYYIPLDYVEEYIKNDSAEKGLLPVQIKNYGSDTAFLRRFKGSNFAGPTEAQLKMMYDGFGEWKLIDLKYKNEEGKDIQRTILYVYVNGSWMVGDSGTLVQ